MSDGTILKALERMGYKGEMTGHGFRGVASTILHESGYPDPHIDIQLAHLKKNKVKAAYDHPLYDWIYIEDAVALGISAHIRHTE
jgi:hypothetical protein